MKTRRELQEEYRKRRPPMGVLVLRNARNGRFQVHASVNLPARMNRLRVELTPATNPNRALLDDWRTMGPEAFDIRVLDVLEPRDEAGWDPAEDLEELARMWRERLLAEGGTPY
jgi:hypothetical protein